MSTITNYVEYKRIVSVLSAAAEAYYTGEVSDLSDEEYDSLLDSVKDWETVHPRQTVKHSLYEVSGGFGTGTVKHDTPMLSLDKVRTLEEIKEFAGKELSRGRTLLLEPKYDGIAMSVVLDAHGGLVKAVTRGNGIEGEDLTHKLRFLQQNKQLVFVNVPPDGEEHRGELLVSFKNFLHVNKLRRLEREKLEREKERLVRSAPEASRVEITNKFAARAKEYTDYANPRNIVTGVLKAKVFTEADYFAEKARRDAERKAGKRNKYGTDRDLKISPDPTVTLTFVPHDNVSLYTVSELSSIDELMKKIKSFGLTRRESFPYPTDGVVLTVPPADRDYSESTSRAPKWAKAYKFEAEKALTVIRDIQMGVGKTGNISFTALVDPVFVDGSLITKATLHNYDFIQENGLRIGDTVEIFKANDIIPRIEKPILERRPADSVPYTVDPVCPISGTPLDTSQVVWRSLAPEASAGAWLAFAVSRAALDIDGFGEKIANFLIQQDYVKDFADLFSLTEEQLSNIPKIDTLNEDGTVTQRMNKDGSLSILGDTIAHALYTEIQKARSKPLSRFIAALSIKGVGTTFSRRLARQVPNLSSLVDSNYTIPLVEGFADGRRKLLLAGLENRKETIRKLVLLGINPTREATVVSSPVKGLTFVITGAPTGKLEGYSRQQVNEMIESHGGKTSGSVSKKTSFLVSTETGTSKYKNAIKLGVPVITPDQLAELLGF